MSFDRTLQNVSTAIGIMFACVFAIVCGSLVGGGQFKVLAVIFLGVATIATVVAWRAGIWLLIPLCWELSGQIPITGLPVGVRDIAVGIAAIGFLIFFALKLLRTKPAFDFLNFVIFVNLGYIATVFIRNPVGVDWLGSDLVGGRPYFNFLVAFVAFLVLTRAPPKLGTIRWVPFMFLVGGVFVSLGLLVTAFAPSTASILSRAYSAFAPAELASGSTEFEDVVGRKPGLLVGGLYLTRLVCSYYRPISLLSLRNWLGTIGFLVGFTAILFSGFRNAVLSVFAYCAISSYFRNRWRDIGKLIAVGVLALSFVLLANNRIFSLPLSAQRALSFLPGNWDPAAASSAQGTAEWRFEMWWMVLTEDRWIRNKWLGDGFGFSRGDLGIMKSSQGFIGGAAQEAFLISGAYHSGPLSAVRYVGYVGLVLLLVFLWALFTRAARLMRQTRGTPFFPVALFIGIPLIYKPFDYIFVFGGYDSTVPELLMMAGLIKLINGAHGRFRADLAASPLAGAAFPVDTPAGEADINVKHPRPSVKI